MRMTDRQIRQLSGLTDKQFKSKYKRKKRTKKQKRDWWLNLTSEQQGKQLDKWMKAKKAKRKARSIEIMRKADIKHNCKTCIHKMTKSCTDMLKWGCEYWFNTESKIRGLAYENDIIDETNREAWQMKLLKKNPKLIIKVA